MRLTDVMANWFKVFLCTVFFAAFVTMFAFAIKACIKSDEFVIPPKEDPGHRRAKIEYENALYTAVFGTPAALFGMIFMFKLTIRVIDNANQ